MKYMLTWWERPGDSYSEHEAAQKRILEIFEKWEIPESLTFHQFLVRVGEFGGYAVVETSLGARRTRPPNECTKVDARKLNFRFTEFV